MQMARLSAWWRHLGRPGRIAVIILAVVVGLGALVAIPSGDNQGSKKAPPPGPGDKRIEAPLLVKRITEYNSSWTFTEKENGTIEVRTDIHRNDEGREFAVAICNLTRFSGDKDKDVLVFGSDGDLLAHHVQASFFSSTTCEKDL
jgi:hypothetical protein